jgi:hypothetical protein
MTFLAEVDAMGLLSLCEKIMERFLIFVIAERTKYSIDSPLITTIGTEEIPLAYFLFQKT